MTHPDHIRLISNSGHDTDPTTSQRNHAIVSDALADGTDRDAGEFGPWLDRTDSVLRDKQPASVPCGRCTGCCRGSFFIEIAPHETATLARIPAPLLFGAPGLPDGHKVMGFDKNGHCPMLVDDACSIYADRPATCRQFDCRTQVAAGIVDTDQAKSPVAQQVLRWHFAVGSDEARASLAAIRRAARFMLRHPDVIPGCDHSASRLAGEAIVWREVFLDGSLSDEALRAALLRRVRPGRHQAD